MQVGTDKGAACALLEWRVYTSPMCTYTHSMSFVSAKYDIRCLDWQTDNKKKTGHGAETFIIMSAEGSIGIACGCLPGCKPLMNRLFPRYFGTTNNSSNSNQYPRRWQHNHAKQIDDEESTQQSESLRGESLRPSSPTGAHSRTFAQKAALHRSASGRTKRSAVPSLNPQLSTLGRSSSLNTPRTVYANSMRTPNLQRSSSQQVQSSFTTTITAQSHLSRSTSRQTSRWGSPDINKPLPMRPPPAAVVARRPSASGFRRSRDALKELSGVSNASTELFILQGRDSGSGKQSPERKNDIWMG